MIDAFLEVFYILDIQVIILAALLFFSGYVLAPTAYYKKIKWMTIYPFFIIHLMDKYFKREWPGLLIFAVILVLNSLSMLVNLLSGWIFFLPYILIIYMGLNVGVVMYHMLEGRFYYISLFNPVAMIELPVAWISIAMAIQFSINRFFEEKMFVDVSFGQYISCFIYTILPLLFIAAIIETVIIILARRQESEDI